MSKLPEWYFLLRPELRPTGERIDKLEALRVKYEIPSKVFASGYLVLSWGSPDFTDKSLQTSKEKMA